MPWCPEDLLEWWGAPPSSSQASASSTTVPQTCRQPQVGSPCDFWCQRITSCAGLAQQDSLCSRMPLGAARSRYAVTAISQGATLTRGLGAGTMRGSFQMVELGKGNEPVRTFDAVVPSVLLQS